MLSVILPVYNEEARLAASVDAIQGYMARRGRPFEIVIAEDGSSDGSYKVAKALSEKRPGIIILHSDSRLGRGESLNRAIRICRGEYVIYMDADLATDLGHIEEVAERLGAGASVVTGSRLMPGSSTDRALSRDVASRAYNGLARLLFGSAVHDHQCGFKGFNKKDVLGLTGLVEDKHWFWDTELLIQAQRRGFRVDEIPVQWVHAGGDGRKSKVSLTRDTIYMGWSLVRMRWRLSFAPGLGPA